MAKKKSKSKTRKPVEQDIPQFDFRQKERTQQILHRILASQNFESAEEMDAFFEKHISGRPIQDIADEFGIDESNEERALELVWEAEQQSSLEDVIELANEALQLDPNCVDAMKLLAWCESSSPKDCIRRLRAVINKVEKNLGPRYIKDNEGQFWTIFETRPYMRLLSDLFQLLVEQGLDKAAVIEGEKLLRLSTGDNFGIRYQLLCLYLELGNLAGARRLFDQYDEEQFSVVFAWGRAFERLLSGKEKEAIEAAGRADEFNPYFSELFVEPESLPEETPPMYAPGSFEEAATYFEMLLRIAVNHPEVLALVAFVLASKGYDLNNLGNSDDI